MKAYICLYMFDVVYICLNMFMQVSISEVLKL